jgi:hypothetical protein
LRPVSTQRTDKAIHVPKTGEQTFWYEAGLEAGLARPCACEGVLRSETALHRVAEAAAAFVDYSPTDEAHKHSAVRFMTVEGDLRRAVKAWRTTPTGSEDT